MPPAAFDAMSAVLVTRWNAAPNVHSEPARNWSQPACSAIVPSRCVSARSAKRARAAKGRSARTPETIARNSLPVRGTATRCAIADPTDGVTRSSARSIRSTDAARPVTKRPTWLASGPPAAMSPSPPDFSCVMGGVAPPPLCSAGGARFTRTSPAHSADGRRNTRSTTGPGPAAEGFEGGRLHDDRVDRRERPGRSTARPRTADRRRRGHRA